MSDDEDDNTTLIATTAPASRVAPSFSVPTPARPPSVSSSSDDAEGFSSSSSDDEDEEPAGHQPAAYTGRQCGVNAWTDCTVPPPTKPPPVDYGRRFRVHDYDAIARNEDAVLQALQDDLCSAERSTRAFRRNEHDAAATAASFLCSKLGCDILQEFFHESLFVNPREPVTASTYARIVQLMLRLLERRMLGTHRGQWYAQPERAHMLAVCHQLPEVAAIVRAWGHTDPAAPSNGYVNVGNPVSRLPMYLTYACDQPFADVESLPYREDDVTPAQRFTATLLSVVYAGQVRADPPRPATPPRQPVATPRRRADMPTRQLAVAPRHPAPARRTARPQPSRCVLSTVAIAQLDAIEVPVRSYY
jgi:hypothetical protein